MTPKVYIPLILIAAGLIYMFSSGHQSVEAEIQGNSSAIIAATVSDPAQPDTLDKGPEKIVKSEEEWKEILDSDEYRILRRGGTELPYVNEYWDNKKEGIYYCGACGLPLYSSEHKYKSGTGWPSFWKPVNKSAVEEKPDSSFFMVRTEIVCARCGSHLGHVFEDGPKPTGLRYCMNSLALDFKSSEELQKEETANSMPNDSP